MTKKFALALVSLMVFAAIAVGSASAAPYAINITTGDTVFLGESGLNISSTLVFNVPTDVPKIAWFAAGSNPTTDVPAVIYPVNGTEKSFNIESAMFTGYTGSWYSYNGTAGSAVYAFQVLEPSLKCAIYNNVTGKDITNKKVVADDTVTFRIDSNLFALFARQGSNIMKLAFVAPVTETVNQTAGIDIKVKTPDGATLKALYNQTEATNSLLGVQPTRQDVFLLGTVGVDAWKLSLERYTPGVYTVYAECNVNTMKTNLGSITGKTVSETGTLEMDKDSITVTTDKETVIRNNDFAITLEGRPKTNYYVWFSGTSSFASARNATDVVTADIPPIFTPNQQDVKYLSGGDFAVAFKGTTALNTDLAVNTTGVTPWSAHGVNVTTGSDGSIVIGVSTHSNTKATTYTIRAQKWEAGALDLQLYETVKLKVEKGAVTITASGDGSYYLGEQITLSGTNTDSDYVYLFVTGPNLPSNGGQLTAPKTAVTDNVAGTFVRKSVNVDNTWEYKLETAQIGLDAGTYTIYAVNEPRDKDHLSGTKYDTVSIVIKKPFVTATVSSSTVAKGDKLYIRGTAEGNPTPGVGIWILGKNYWNGENAVVADSRMTTETVNDDGSFEYEFGSGDTTNLAPGQYFVVVQHPMYNDRFDVSSSSVNYPFIAVLPPAAGTVEVQEAIAGAVTPSNRFVIVGAANKLQGSDAANALIEMIDSPDIDDTYTKLTFLIEEPWIRINSIGDHYVGDQFAITGTTNLAVDDDLIVDVTSSSFTATKKSQSGEFSGKSETVKVVEGTTYNEWSMDVDASTFKADEYIVNVESIETSATATTTFNILASKPTATVTGTSTTGPVVTTTATATQATPTETAAPGFGALVALIGLGAVAALVLRKE